MSILYITFLVYFHITFLVYFHIPFLVYFHITFLVYFQITFLVYFHITFGMKVYSIIKCTTTGVILSPFLFPPKKEGIDKTLFFVIHSICTTFCSGFICGVPPHIFFFFFNSDRMVVSMALGGVPLPQGVHCTPHPIFFCFLSDRLVVGIA